MAGQAGVYFGMPAGACDSLLKTSAGGHYISTQSVQSFRAEGEPIFATGNFTTRGR